MVGENLSLPKINVSLSVLKREAKPIDRVRNKLERDGWDTTRILGDNRIIYMEKSGINITLFKGPLGTVITPSGPIRGRLFGDKVRILSSTSSIGAAANTGNSKDNPQQSTRSKSDPPVELQ